MWEHCLKRPWTRFTVKPIKFWVFLNIGNTQILTKFETLYPRKTHNMKEVWTLEVILAINLKHTTDTESRVCKLIL